jgi:hypothetical protein
MKEIAQWGASYFVLVPKYYYADKIREDEVGGTCGTHGTPKRQCYTVRSSSGFPRSVSNSYHTYVGDIHDICRCCLQVDGALGPAGFSTLEPHEDSGSNRYVLWTQLCYIHPATQTSRSRANLQVGGSVRTFAQCGIHVQLSSTFTPPKYFIRRFFPFCRIRLTLWSRSSCKCYLRIQSVPQREHHTSPLQRSTG